MSRDFPEALHLPNEANIFVAREALLTCARSLPIQLSLAQASTGSLGVRAHTSERQSQQAQTVASGSPRPAQGGRASAG